MKILIKDLKGDILDTLERDLFAFTNYLLIAPKKEINQNWFHDSGTANHSMSIELEVSEIDSKDFEIFDNCLKSNNIYSDTRESWFGEDFIYLSKEGIKDYRKEFDKESFYMVCSEYRISTDKSDKLSSLNVIFY